MHEDELAVVLVSGGMDSVTLAYYLRHRGYKLHFLSVNYGQRHWKEIGFAGEHAAKLGAPHDVVDLSSITHLISSSVLTDHSRPVPEGHYAADNMAQTVVPNRNAIMLSIAWGLAVAKNATVVGAAMHAGDHYIYPDCRPEFARVLEKAFKSGNEGFGSPYLKLTTPFIGHTKANIVKAGAQLDVDYSLTWSCYVGGSRHCGACGTCVERIEAFREADVNDPTDYEPEGLEKYRQLRAIGKVK
jgi:7-cyano-7-deazaguanine synthase